MCLYFIICCMVYREASSYSDHIEWRIFSLWDITCVNHRFILSPYVFFVFLSRIFVWSFATKGIQKKWIHTKSSSLKACTIKARWSDGIFQYFSITLILHRKYPNFEMNIYRSYRYLVRTGIWIWDLSTGVALFELFILLIQSGKNSVNLIQ